jgi:hypothetical protein
MLKQNRAALRPTNALDESDMLLTTLTLCRIGRQSRPAQGRYS